jgi:hypothetical protein
MKYAMHDAIAVAIIIIPVASILYFVIEKLII